ncbi:hypothetical protein U1Q18_017344 [Sarracenia purpurea var. burkii]
MKAIPFAFLSISQYTRSALTIEELRVEPRAAPFKESKAFWRLVLMPPWPCLNRLPPPRNNIASLSGRRVSLHDLQTSDASCKFGSPKVVAILVIILHNSIEKSFRLASADEDEI